MNFNNLTVRTTQQPYSAYTFSSCSIDEKLSCHQGDVKYGDKKSGHSLLSQPRCSKLDPDVCPSLDGSEPSDIIWGSASVSAIDVSCSYQIANIQTACAVEDFIDKFAEKNPESVNRLMVSFCSRSALPSKSLPECKHNPTMNPCPIDEITGKQMTDCSRFVSTDRAGDLCAEWVETAMVQKEYHLIDTAYGKWCSSKDAENDCRCFNRTSDAHFSEIHNKLPKKLYGHEGCWYKPCIAGYNNLIPTSVQAEECPLLAGAVEKIVKHSTSSLLPYVNCVQVDDGAGLIQPINAQTQNTTTLSNGYFWLILVLVLILIVVFVFTQRPKMF